MIFKNFFQMISKNGKNIFLNFVYVIFPLFYISYILYVRFNFRPPRNLLEITPLQISFCIFTIIILCIRLYSLLKVYGYVTSKEPKNKIYIYILKRMEINFNIFSNIWVNFYHIVINFNVNIQLFILKFIKYCCYIEQYFNTIYVILDLVPRFLVLFAFFFDIIMYKQLYYFYFSLPLLLLPVLLLVIINILLTFYSDNYDDFKTVLHITFNKDTAQVCISFRENFLCPYYIKDPLHFSNEFLMPLASVPQLLCSLANSKCRFYGDVFDILITFFYIIGWFIILFLGVAFL